MGNSHFAMIPPDFFFPGGFGFAAPEKYMLFESKKAPKHLIWNS